MPSRARDGRGRDVYVSGSRTPSPAPLWARGGEGQPAAAAEAPPEPKFMDYNGRQIRVSHGPTTSFQSAAAAKAPAARDPLPPHTAHAAASQAAATLRGRRHAAAAGQEPTKARAKRRSNGGLLLALPADIQAQVLALLSTKDLGRMACACHSWRRVSSDPNSWRQRFEAKWPKAYLRASSGLAPKVVARVDWKMHYRSYRFQLAVRRHENSQKQEVAAARRQHLEYSKWSELGGRGQAKMFSNLLAGQHPSERQRRGGGGGGGGYGRPRTTSVGGGRRADWQRGDEYLGKGGTEHMLEHMRANTRRYLRAHVHQSALQERAARGR
eukprot:SAG22_NODE_1430_length_4441_cov_2.360894_3_plen_326_part_00